MLFGWTLKQWGLAIALMNADPKTLLDAVKVKRSYLRKRRMNPIEELTLYYPEGDTRPCDYECALKLMELIPR